MGKTSDKHQCEMCGNLLKKYGDLAHSNQIYKCVNYACPVGFICPNCSSTIYERRPTGLGSSKYTCTACGCSWEWPVVKKVVKTNAYETSKD